MNYLAHAYLSGTSEGIIIGNFIGDSVKGKQYLSYSADIQKGILIHRQIDSFTDQHPVVKQCADCFRPVYGRYAGIVTDVVFDHFLAKYWDNWSDEVFSGFVKHVHSVLLANFAYLPVDVKGFLPFFIAHRRLESYATIEGIGHTLEAMGRRTSLPRQSDEAVRILRDEFFSIKSGFDVFFPELIRFVEHQFAINVQKKGPEFLKRKLKLAD